MAVSFVARKCTQCAGKLQYIKEKKIWKCLYCGAEIEREEQYDGLFTIKNVVRQSLLDTAYHRLDSASQNIVECEKIDSRYVGTLIAKIAYAMITIITPDACSERDVKNILAQLKKNYELLQSENASISDEEEALYEFLEEADIYATLILVFDSLGDTLRRDYVASLLDAKEIYSKAVNNNLLSYALKNHHFAIIDDIISNANNLDVQIALSEMLEKYPDGEKKGPNICRLFDTGVLKPEDKPIVEKYISTSSDSTATKVSVIVSALKNGMKIELESIIDHVLKSADQEQVNEIVSVVCQKKLTDAEVLGLVDFGFSSDSVDIAIDILDCLKTSDQYLLIPAKFLILLLNMSSYSAEDQVKILHKCFEFKIDHKAFESVMTNYLCYNTSSIRDRKIVLNCLFEKTDSFPTKTVETYVLQSNTDGAEKADIISDMFDKGLNISFFNDLLSKYLNSNIDPTETREKVVDVLARQGLKIDPGSFIDYICASSDELPKKMQFIKKMIDSGSQLRGDAANTYLERTDPSTFSSELFTLIFLPDSTFSERGIEKYLLEMKDHEVNKSRNLKTIIEHSNVNLSALRNHIIHLNNPIECNLLQAYLLTTTDSLQPATEIIDYLINQIKLKINEEISVSGSRMKLKKYVVANKAELSSVTDAMCKKYRVYSMLF